MIAALESWYPGRVCSIRELRPHGVIQDDGIPDLLLTLKNPVFVSTNTTDFWQSVKAHGGYSVVLIPLPNDRQGEISPTIRALYQLGPFSTVRLRMGKVALLMRETVRFYSTRGYDVVSIPWQLE